jgi:hypothetical protein
VAAELSAAFAGPSARFVMGSEDVAITVTYEVASGEKGAML